MADKPDKPQPDMDALLKGIQPRELCTIGTDGTVSDRALHDEILGPVEGPLGDVRAIQDEIEAIEQSRTAGGAPCPK